MEGLIAKARRGSRSLEMRGNRCEEVPAVTRAIIAVAGDVSPFLPGAEPVSAWRLSCGLPASARLVGSAPFFAIFSTLTNTSRLSLKFRHFRHILP